MNAFASAGDTWGIGGLAFGVAYGAALVVLLVISLAIRFVALRGHGTGRRRQPSTAELAVVVEGRTRAVHASLAALRLAGAVDIGPEYTLTATAPMPPDVSPLDVAIYGAAVRGARINDVAADRNVAAALDDIQSAVRRCGWLLTEADRRWADAGKWLLSLLALVGVARVIAELVDGGELGNFAALVLVTGFAAFSFRDPPTVSRAGERAVARQRRSFSYLAPQQNPAWQTYGFRALAMGVALFGTAALWSADPAFAANIGLARQSSYRTTESGSGGGDSGGSDGGCGGCGD